MQIFKIFFSNTSDVGDLYSVKQHPPNSNAVNLNFILSTF